MRRNVDFSGLIKNLNCFGKTSGSPGMKRGAGEFQSCLDMQGFLFIRSGFLVIKNWVLILESFLELR